jgi:hypothetical protein
LFRKQGLQYVEADRTKSDLFVEMLPVLTSGRAQLLDHDRLVAQLLSLERRTGAGGKDTITHPRDTHDDVANAVAGALVKAARRPGMKAFEGYTAPAATGPLDAPRMWTCPKCGDSGLTDAREPRCAACSSGGPTWRQLLGW